MSPAVPVSAAGVIATFYSYKGGTGRSMALANIGCLLGKSLGATGRVLLIDWDLEAPGLFRYFPICDLPEHVERAGIIDYFTEVRRQVETTPGLYAAISEPGGWEALEKAVPLDPYLVLNVASGVDLVKAGRGSIDYAHRVASFDWAEFFRQYQLVYAAFRALLSQRYAWTLIDSRTGLTDTSGVCSMLLPEKLVAVFTPNRQSIEGVIDLIQKAVRYRRESEDSRPLAVFPLPSRIVTEEHKLLQQAQAEYRSDFEACIRQAYGLDLPDDFLGPYFDEVAIPHKSFYGFREQVAVRDDEKTTDALSINRAYERFFRRFTLLKRAWDSPPAATAGDAPLGPFKFDVFISYAHIDNQPSAGEQAGWVTRFVRDLEIRVAMRVGKRQSIFFDQLRLTAADALNEQVQSALIDSAVLVPILSPAYYNSHYAQRELAEFQHRAGTFNPGLSRIVPVELLPAPVSLLPEIMHARAFDSASRSGAVEIYQPESPQYRAFLEDVAEAIATLLKKLRQPVSAEGRPAGANATHVYLAETTSDLRAIRDRLRTELVQYGYTVLPQEAPSTDATELVQTLRYDLPRVRASLHLFSAKYGLVPEGETRAVGHIQCAMAAEFPIQRLIWTEASTEPPDPRQQEFMDGLNHQLGAGTELVRGSFESYRELVLDRLRALSIPVETARGRSSVYLVCRPEDFSAVARLRDLLLASNMEAILPATEGSPAELREDHQQNLQSADGVVVYWGAGTETWMRAQQRDLLKERNRRTGPLHALIAMAPPATDTKDAFRTIEFPTVALGADTSRLVDAIRESLTGNSR